MFYKRGNPTANVTAPLARVPGAPTSVLADLAGSPDGTVHVKWNAPADTGTATLDQYQVQSSPSGLLQLAIGATEVQFTGLNDGTPYVFSVRAHNSVGYGPFSANSNGATPQAPAVGGSSSIQQVGNVGTDSSNGTANPTQPLVMVCPTGVVDGDLLIVGMADSTTASAITPPSGWTALDTGNIANNPAAGVYYRVASGETAGTTSYTFTLGPGRAIGIITALRGVDGSAPFDAHAIQLNSASSSDMAYPAITTTVAGTRLFGFGFSRTTALVSGSAVPPDGWTEQADWSSTSTTTTNIVGEFINAIPTVVGAQGSPTSTLATPGTSITFTFAVKPAAVGGSAAYRIGNAGSAIQNGGTNTVILTCPAGTATGDVMYVAVGNQTTTASLTAPSGWTLVDTGTVTALLANLYSRTATSADVGGTTTYTWTLPGGRGAGAIVSTRNGAIDDHQVQINSTAATGVVVPDVITTQANAYLLSFVVARTVANAQTTLTPPTGFTELTDVTTTSTTTTDIVVESMQKNAGAAGAQSVPNATAAASVTSVSFTLALRGVSAGGSSGGGSGSGGTTPVVQSDKFADMPRANTHMQYGARTNMPASIYKQKGPYSSDLVAVATALKQLKIRGIRDLINLSDTTTRSRFSTLNSLTKVPSAVPKGIQVMFNGGDMIGGGGTVPDGVKCVTEIITYHADYCDGFEGSNEPDLAGYNSGTPPAWVTTTKNQMNAVWGDGRLQAAGIPIACPPMGQAGNGETPYKTYGSDKTRANALAFHIYAGGHKPSTGITSSYTYAKNNIMGPGYSNWMTENGYENYMARSGTAGNPPVPEAIAGIYLPKMIAEAWKRLFDPVYPTKFPRFYMFELGDLYPNSTTYAHHFGLYAWTVDENTDWVTGDPAAWRAKPAALAVANLMSLVIDPGVDFTPSPLNGTLSALPTDMSAVFLGKRNGQQLVLLWRDVEIYNVTSKTNITVTPATEDVTLTLNAPSSVSRFGRRSVVRRRATRPARRIL